MNTKGIFITGLTVGAFMLAPAAFAEEGSHAGKEMKSDASQESSETPSTEQKNTMEPARTEQKKTMESAETKEPGQMRTAEAQILKASEVIGYTVKNAEGQELGEIEDLVIDPDHGRIAYAVLSFGGFLGMGDKFFAIPWEAMKPLPTEQTVRLDVAKEKLEKAPGFNKDAWPNMADREWGLVVYKYYELDPYWQ